MTRRHRSTASRAAALLAGLAIALAGPRAASAQVLMTEEEALRLAFPTATRIEARTVTLDSAQLAAASRLVGAEAEPPRPKFTLYVARQGERPLGVAYVDAHVVRTALEVAMVVVSPQGSVERVEVLRFHEPREYRATPAWIRQLLGQRLDAELALGAGKVRLLSGATLTSRALVGAARRSLALHRVLAPLGAAAPAR